MLLKGIDGSALIEKYYYTPANEPMTTPVESDFTMTELLHDKHKSAYYFHDSTKAKAKFWVNMYDPHSNGPIQRYTTLPCWWCRATFKWHPIGCPIEYSPSCDGAKKKMFDAHLASMSLKSDTSDFFIVEGIFCSFPCVKSYIADQCSRNTGSKYKDACTNLTLLYQKLYGATDDIPYAGSWKALKEWGGHLTIDEFRQTFGRLMYEETPNIRRPYIYCSSSYIKEIRV